MLVYFPQSVAVNISLTLEGDEYFMLDGEDLKKTEIKGKLSIKGPTVDLNLANIVAQQLDLEFRECACKLKDVSASLKQATIQHGMYHEFLHKEV